MILALIAIHYVSTTLSSAIVVRNQLWVICKWMVVARFSPHFANPLLKLKADYINKIYWNVRVSQGAQWKCACQWRRPRKHGFDPWVRKIPWRRKWHPTPVFLPVESYGQRSLVGCSPWGCKELYMSEHACTHYSEISIALLESGLGIITNINCRL